MAQKAKKKKGNKSTRRVNKKEMHREHKRLVRILEDGSHSERKEEARKQKAEMNEYR